VLPKRTYATHFLKQFFTFSNTIFDRYRHVENSSCSRKKPMNSLTFNSWLICYFLRG